MAGTHGRRKYLQILLEPHRAEILQALADERNMRLTGLAREMIYDGIKKASSILEYREAEAKDAAVWRESVRNRIEGRTKKRKEIEESENNSSK